MKIQRNDQKSITTTARMANGKQAKKTCQLRAEETADTKKIFTPAALAFLFNLEKKFGAKRRELLKLRDVRQQEYDSGSLPHFNPDTAHIRAGEWMIDPVPEILQDRRVEITGPVDRKMMINALNSGAKVFMGDFEDATAPTFGNILAGQINVMDYAAGTLEYTDSKTGKAYHVQDDPALMIIRPRGLHLEEAHLHINGRSLSASFVDFGLHIFHNGQALAQNNLGPFYYLPKLESHLEARLWNDIFIYAQKRLGLKKGTIKATVLIETLPAAFEMEEILYELRHHVAGLNCGRWDYIFSYIKTLRNHASFVLPDRADVTMDQAFLKAYCVQLIDVCHRRGAHAMGGMAAQIPIKNDEEANALAIKKVRADKVREAELYHDGTWVAHPALVQPALDVFNMSMSSANNIHRQCREKSPHPSDLLAPHQGHITEQGVRTNIAVALEYIASWLQGRGAVPINNLMEDAATAEICRTQLWQWLKFRCLMITQSNEQIHITKALFRTMLDEEFEKLLMLVFKDENNLEYLTTAKIILQDSVLSDKLQSFITLPAYQYLSQQIV